MEDCAFLFSKNPDKVFCFFADAGGVDDIFSVSFL
jgi:hypothetical protein